MMIDPVKWRAFLSFVCSLVMLEVSVASAPDRKVEYVRQSGIRAQIKLFQSADVLVLNQVDWGMKRTGYRCVVCELGKALNMNWPELRGEFW